MPEFATMGAEIAPEHAATVERLKSALANGQLDAAEELAAHVPADAPVAARLVVAQLHMRRQRWADAAEVLAALAPVDQTAALQRNVCRNFESLQRHRPDVYHAVMSCTDEERYVLGVGARGQLTIYYRRPDGRPLCLSPGADPAGGILHAKNLLRQHLEEGNAISLSGIGDGYFLNHVAHHPPELPLGRQQAICLVEPDARAVLACMALHDYTGPDGPIEQPRFAWFIGAGWKRRMEAYFLGDLANPLPAHELRQCVRAAEITAAMQEILTHTKNRHEAMQAQVEAYYAGIRHEEWCAIFSQTPPRPPRVMFVTTRFSSVLQYSTRDAADGFRANGWEARVFIEPAAHQGLTLPRVAQWLHEFKPDVIFQIDHLRSEWPEAFPPALPFVCWVQDHLPNLTSAAAGAAVMRRDFILCGMPAMYIDRFGYPARQCLHMARLTRIPERPATWEPNGDDLVYVSTASAIPAERARELYEDPAFDAPTRTLLKASCLEILAVYARGECLSTPRTVMEVIQRVAPTIGLRINSDERLREMGDLLFDRLSNPLYRQQALHWAVDVARRHGLRLAIYGPGWEKHPDFAPFARGPISYGPELESLTRASRICLVLEPYFAPAHQRLLDALVAGGFCLVRHHPSNSIFQELLNFLCDRQKGDSPPYSDRQKGDSPPYSDDHHTLDRDNRDSPGFSCPLPCTQGRGQGEGLSRIAHGSEEPAPPAHRPLTPAVSPEYRGEGVADDRNKGVCPPSANRNKGVGPPSANRNKGVSPPSANDRRSVDAVRAALAPAEIAAFEEILRRWNELFLLGDPVAYVMGALEAGKMAPQPAALPALDQVSFADRDELERRVLAFVNDTARRNDIARQQRGDVESRLSYAAGMKRIAKCLGSLIAAEAAP